MLTNEDEEALAIQRTYTILTTNYAIEGTNYKLHRQATTKPFLRLGL